jgi:hypothetical protein
LPWESLLQFPEPKQQELNRWLRETIPLLARPEIGFPLKVQELLLNTLPTEQVVKQELHKRRRRLVTDALVATAIQRGEPVNIPEDRKVEELITTIDREYKEVQGGNIWAERIEQPDSAKIDSSGSSGGGD